MAALATVGPDGYPQMSELWFLADGDTLQLSLNTSWQKVKNLPFASARLLAESRLARDR